MSTLSSILNNQFSSLSGQKDDKQTAATSLAQALSGASSAAVNNKAASTADVSYLLNLSAEAKNYLATQASKTEATDSKAESFILSPQQQKQLNGIIDSYKDKPFTQENFDAMLKELNSAGLAPDQMAAKDQVKQLNPTALFLNAINGGDQTLTFSGATGETQKAKADAYLQNIYDQWESISTTAGAES